MRQPPVPAVGLDCPGDRSGASGGLSELGWAVHDVPPLTGTR